MSLINRKESGGPQADGVDRQPGIRELLEGPSEEVSKSNLRGPLDRDDDGIDVIFGARGERPD